MQTFSFGVLYVDKKICGQRVKLSTPLGVFLATIPGCESQPLGTIYSRWNVDETAPSCVCLFGDFLTDSIRWDSSPN